MKAFQRILAVLLCLVMSLGMISMVASAAPTDATIDTNLRGSITIHKYEYNGNADLKKGDGTTASADDLPEGAEELAGAGFTIYKVADLRYLDSDYPAISTYVNDDGTIKDATKKVGNEVKTGTDGIAKFENLALGLYVVIETTTPDAVTDPCDPFFVSVPMTKVDGSGWLYDIDVYPKNGTSFGKVELEKKGSDGVKLDGVTFKLEKQDATEEDGWKDITQQSGAAGDNSGAALNLTTNADGKITVEGLSKGTYRFIETSVGENVGYIMDGGSTYEFTVNEDATITYKGNTGAAITINVVNEKPDLNKEIQKANGAWGDDADYSVGDTVNYRVTVRVPENIAKLKTFKVTDDPTGATVVTGSVKAYKADGETQLRGYTVDVYNSDGFVINFPPTTAGTLANTPLVEEASKNIVITYSATLDADAVTTSAGNPNTATLEYTNKINADGTPADTTDKISDQATVYTFKLDVTKVGEGDKPLSGVKFDLYLYNGTETVTETLLKDTSKATKVKTGLTTGANGKITVSGLENGNYYLVETQTNAEYNLLKAPVKVQINVAYTTKTTTTTTYNENGDVIATTVTTETFTESSETANDGIFGVKVVNKKGFELPQTGGIGTLMFIIIGGVLMAGGICLIVPNKKRAV